VRRRALTAGLGLALVSWSGCGRDAPPTTDELLAGATYLTEASPDGAVALEDGRYDFPPGSEVEHVEILTSATGDFDGDDVTDAAVVLEETAGVNRFLRLHAMLGDGEDFEDVASRLLGDRITVDRVSVADGIITLGLTTRKPGENVEVPPSATATTRYALTDRGLVPIDPPDVRDASGGSPGLGAPPSLTSHEWILQDIEIGEWRQSMDALERRPSLRFAQELGDPSSGTGQLSGYAGCNQVFGSYQTGEGGSIGILGLTATRRRCDEDATDLEERILAALGAVRSWSVEDDGLTLEFDGGILRLRAGGELEPASAPAMDTGAVDRPGTGRQT